MLSNIYDIFHDKIQSEQVIIKQPSCYLSINMLYNIIFFIDYFEKADSFAFNK